jgi:low temperature requirement protein LtrA
MPSAQTLACLCLRVVAFWVAVGHLLWLVGNLLTGFHFADLAYWVYFVQLHLVRPVLGLLVALLIYNSSAPLSRWMTRRI